MSTEAAHQRRGVANGIWTAPGAEGAALDGDVAGTRM